MAINVKPLGDRILVEPAEEKEVKKGGIIIPDSAKESPPKASSLLSAPAKLTTAERKFRLKSKREIACSSPSTAAQKIKLNDKDYKIFNADDVIAIIE